MYEITLNCTSNFVITARLEHRHDPTEISDYLTEVLNTVMKEFPDLQFVSTVSHVESVTEIEQIAR